MTFERLKPAFEFAIHGIPERLSSDNGPPYSSDEMKQYAKEMGILKDPVIADEPQCNGFVENFVKTFL